MTSPADNSPLLVCERVSKTYRMGDVDVRALRATDLTVCFASHGDDDVIVLGNEFEKLERLTECFQLLLNLFAATAMLLYRTFCFLVLLLELFKSLSCQDWVCALILFRVIVIVVLNIVAVTLIVMVIFIVLAIVIVVVIVAFVVVILVIVRVIVVVAVIVIVIVIVTIVVLVIVIVSIIVIVIVIVSSWGLLAGLWALLGSEMWSQILM